MKDNLKLQEFSTLGLKVKPFMTTPRKEIAMFVIVAEIDTRVQPDPFYETYQICHAAGNALDKRRAIQAHQRHPEIVEHRKDLILNHSVRVQQIISPFIKTYESKGIAVELLSYEVCLSQVPPSTSPYVTTIEEYGHLYAEVTLSRAESLRFVNAAYN